MENDEILTAKEAAEYLKISLQTIYQLKAAGKVPFKKIGGSLRFLKSELYNWLKEQ